jgi:hypothetical protein
MLPNVTPVTARPLVPIVLLECIEVPNVSLEFRDHRLELSGVCPCDVGTNLPDALKPLTRVDLCVCEPRQAGSARGLQAAKLPSRPNLACAGASGCRIQGIFTRSGGNMPSATATNMNRPG